MSKFHKKYIVSNCLNFDNSIRVIVCIIFRSLSSALHLMKIFNDPSMEYWLLDDNCFYRLTQVRLGMHGKYEWR